MVNNKKILQARQQISQAIDLARVCLGDERFKKYADQYRKTEESLIDELINVSDEIRDPVEYALEVKEVLAELRTVKRLLADVRNQAHVKE